MLKINWKLVAEFYLTLFIPLLYLINIYIAFISKPNDYTILNILGIFVAILGLSFWILSYINLGSSFGVLPQKQKKIKRGIYNYFSHPMYIGISAVMIGISIARSSFYGLAFYCLILLPILVIRIRFEEKNLKN